MIYLILIYIVLIIIFYCFFNYNNVDNSNNWKQMGKFLIKKTDKKGKGLFAVENIKKYEIIEVAPVLYDYRMFYRFNIGKLRDYVFGINKDIIAIPLGYVGMLNHSDKSNCKIKFFLDKIVLRAFEDIPKGTELTINYGNEYWDTRKKYLNKDKYS